MKRSTLILGMVAALTSFQAGCEQKSDYQPPPPPKVSVVQPVVETVPIFLVENGETEAVEEAIVQARVRGILQELSFEPNAIVEEGISQLFLIEPQEYEAAVESAVATVNSAEAEVVSAEADIEVAQARIAAADAFVSVSQAEFDRLKKLLIGKAISQSEFDTAEAQLETAKASQHGEIAAKGAAEAKANNARAMVQQAKADLVQSELDLKRTVVMAPISGRITRTLVKRGNLVENGTPLIVIVKNSPIWANFNINERFLLNLERSGTRKKDRSIDPSSFKVQLQRSGDVGFPFEGHLDYWDPKVDQETGTLQLRAVFENKNLENILMPGLFVRVRIQIGELKDALLVPERAASRDQAGAFVYVVADDNKAERKNVVLGIKHNELIVIESGIEPGVSVIVDGIQRVRPGIVVDPG